MGTKLIKRVQVVQEYLLVGDANSSSADYWEKDFREQRCIAVGKPAVSTITQLRPMRDDEIALLGERQNDDE